MGVALLNPQDCLRSPSAQQPLIFPPQKMKVLKNAPNSSSKTNRSIRNHQKHPKRSLLRYQNDPKSAGKPQPNKLVMGQVKILKRGEQLSNAAADPSSDFAKKSDRGVRALGSPKRLAPKSQPSPAETASGLYAGSSMFVASPPPSSVPLPAFCTKKMVSDATSDLRRILRLDLP